MLIFLQELCLQLFLWLLQLIDGLMEIFSGVAGVTNVRVNGQSVNIIEYLAGNSMVGTIFWCIFYFGSRLNVYLHNSRTCQEHDIRIIQ